MYTYKQAVIDSKEYLDTGIAQTLLEQVDAPIKQPSYRDLIEAVDEVYKLFYKSLLFRGALYEYFYKKRHTLKDEMFIDDLLGRLIIKPLVLFYFCEKFTAPELKDLRVLITELINMYQAYILSPSVTIKEYNDMIELDNY